MRTDEARALLRQLRDLATQPELVYTHRWKPWDLVIWDNRCTLHRGRPWNESRYRRVMHRTTVAGDGPTVARHDPAHVTATRAIDIEWGRSQLEAV
jgi:alpha-ketoglutarate-dependent 2,4-dichlorophenoxyacetate dioxygenase